MNTGRPTRVLHIIHWPVSGIVVLFKNVLALMPDDIESHVVFFDYDENTEADFRKICKSVHFLKISSSRAGAVVAFRRLIKEISPDILHTHSFLPMALVTMFTLGRKKHINTVHSEYPYFSAKGLKPFIKRTIHKNFLNLFGTKAVAVSKRVRQSLRDIGVAEKNLELIENGVRTLAPAIPAEAVKRARAEFLCEKGDVSIITVGRLDRLKGFDYLLPAFSALNKKHANTKLIFIGAGQELEHMKELISRLGIERSVRLLGYKKDPQPYLAAADIYVCSSTTEGFSLAVTEAMLSALPVVATSVGSNTDLVDDGVSGYIVEPGVPEALAQALEKLMLNPGKMDMGVEGRKKILDNFSIDKTAGLYHDLYRKICAG